MDNHRLDTDQTATANELGIPGLTRRRVMQVTATGLVAGGLGFGTGVVGAQPLEDLCQAVQLDVVIVLDQSGSMSLGTPTRMQRAKDGATALVNALNVSTAGAHVGVVTFAGGPVSSDIPLFEPLTDDATTALNAIASIPDVPPAGALTNMEAGVQAAREELTGTDYTADIVASGNDRPGAEKIMVFLGDGVPTLDNHPDDEDDPLTFPALGGLDPSEEAESAKTVDDIEIFTIGIDLVPLAEDLLEDMASEPKATHAFPSVDLELIEETFEEIAAEICPTEVDIDIKPGSDPNAINCRPNRNGVIPVAVLSTDTFDATTVDPASLRFGSPSTVIGGGGATLAHGAGHLEDVDGDADLDFLGHFPVSDAGFTSGDTQGVLVGETTGGETIAGVDSVKIVGKCP